MITLALAKGRLFTDFVRYLEEKGMAHWHELLSKVDRELVLENHDVRFLLVKGDDVPRYVEEGIADIGIVGSDVLLEYPSSVFNLMGLPFGKCHFAIASLDGKTDWNVIASKYINYTRRYFDNQMKEVKIIKLSGSVELAATIGMADAIVDIVQSGETLHKNHLYERVILDQISARLIANKHAYFTRYEVIQDIINQLKAE